jgi:glycosyltransferase involved in cell wall biosynthesis
MSVAATAQPTVSVIIPTRNAREYVADAVRSVLDQPGVDLDVIVIDDGSTDGSADIVRALNDSRVGIIPGPRAGISAAMNAGIEAARGTFLARCDADDLYPAGRLTKQLAWLVSNPDFAAVCGSFRTITAKGRPVSDLNCGATATEITDELRRGATRTHLCTFLFRTDALRATGGFRAWFVTAEDIDLQLRFGQANRVWYDPTPAYAYRLHGSSITHTQADVARQFYEAQARRFLQQRVERGEDDLQRGCPPSPPVNGAGGGAPISTGAHVQGMLVGESWRQHRAGQKGKSLVTGFRACLARPASFSAWRNLGALAIKRSKPA